MASEKEVKKAFTVFDIEQEGQIQADELENALRIAKMNPTSKDVQEKLQKIGNPDKVTYEQFKTIVKEISCIDQTKELKEAFGCFDPKKLGYITPETLREIVEPMLGGDLTEHELDDVIKRADLDGDGKIDIDEFVTFMMGDEDEEQSPQ